MFVEKLHTLIPTVIFMATVAIAAWITSRNIMKGMNVPDDDDMETAPLRYGLKPVTVSLLRGWIVSPIVFVLLWILPILVCCDGLTLTAMRLSLAVSIISAILSQFRVIERLNNYDQPKSWNDHMKEKTNIGPLMRFGINLICAYVIIAVTVSGQSLWLGYVYSILIDTCGAIVMLMLAKQLNNKTD